MDQHTLQMTDIDVFGFFNSDIIEEYCSDRANMKYFSVFSLQNFIDQSQSVNQNIKVIQIGHIW